MKTALVHDWLVSIGGAEKVLESVLKVFPSPIYTLVKSGKILNNNTVHTSFLQNLPFAQKLYRNYLPLFPLAVEQFDLSEYEVVLSSSHAVAKGVLTHKDQLHICYCHSPMRHAWDLYHDHMKGLKGLKRLAAQWALHRIRQWDISSLPRVDCFIANSHFIAQRIKKIYGREATVIYPPVSTDLFFSYPKEGFYITVSRLVPYKRIDLIVEAFNQMPSKKLYVIGEGPELKNLKKVAGPHIEFLGFQPDEIVRSYLGRAKAFVFAAEEDFGIVPVEAQAAGCPVIAYGKGGVLETVIDHKTGLFFREQTVNSLVDALRRFESLSFNADLIQHHAEKFSESRFKKEIESFVTQKWRQFSESHYSSRR